MRGEVRKQMDVPLQRYHIDLFIEFHIEVHTFHINLIDFPVKLSGHGEDDL
jgi:hypothetical protein